MKLAVLNNCWCKVWKRKGNDQQEDYEFPFPKPCRGLLGLLWWVPELTVYTFCSLKTLNVSTIIQLLSSTNCTCDVWYNPKISIRATRHFLADNRHIIFQWHPFVVHWKSNDSIKSLYVRRSANDDAFCVRLLFSQPSGMVPARRSQQNRLIQVFHQTKHDCMFSRESNKTFYLKLFKYKSFT